MAVKEPATEEGKLVKRWVEELEIAEKVCEDWWRSGDIIIRRYKNEERNGKGNANAAVNPARRYAILWSNVQTIAPAIYAKSPNAVVGRRFKDEDPVGKVASEVLERALNYSLEAYDFDQRMQLVRNDYLLPGRGQVWTRYVPHMKTVDAEEDIDVGEGEADSDELETENEKPEPYEVVEYEEVLCDHVPWKDFLTNPTREWTETRWVARRVFMSRDQLVARFGEEIGRKVPLDWSPAGHTSQDKDHDSAIKRAQVYEIWDKDSRKVYWVSKAYNDGPLDEKDDPLKLSGFFPCPQPLNATMAPDAGLPVPDYVLYQDQAEELDDLTARIARLQDAMRLVGFYAGEESVALQRVFAPGNENKLIPVDTYDIFKEKGGVRGIIEYVPIDMVIQCLKGCYEARQQIINDIYQITGLSDIIRGASDPNETATAQGIKAQWGSLRVRDRQKEVQRFARDIIRIKAEVIAEMFSIETLRQMTGVQLMTNDEKQAAQMQMQQQAIQAQLTGQQPPQPDPKMMEMLNQPSWEDVMDLLRNDSLRSFRIEVETDSTIEADEQGQKQAFTEFVTATTGLMQVAAGIIPAAPYTAPLFAEMMREGARLFRVSKGMEDTIDQVFSQAEQTPPAQPQGPPPPSPVEEAKVQAEMGKLQVEQQRTQVEGQLGMMDAQLRGQELQLKAATLARDPTPQGTV